MTIFSLSQVSIRFDRRSTSKVEVPTGPYQKEAAESSSSSSFVPVPYHEAFLAELALSHAVGDFCVVRQEPSNFTSGGSQHIFVYFRTTPHQTRT